MKQLVKPFSSIFFVGKSALVRRKIFLLTVSVIFGLLILAVLVLASLVFGAETSSLGDVFASINRLWLFGRPLQSYGVRLPRYLGWNLDIILYYSRIPRTIVAILIGSGLAVSGTIMQALVRNPLVDPYITGVSSGAAFGAVLVLLTSFFTGFFETLSLPLAAFIGGLGAFGITFIIYRSAGETSTSFVLGGVIVGIAFSSLTTFIIVTSPKELHGAIFWLFGSIAYVTWDVVWVLLPVISGIVLVSLFFAREFNVLLLGDEQAVQLGVRVKWFKRIMLVVAALLASICVAYTGIIGFVGLVVPHMIRLALGSDHRLLLPLSTIFGANLLLVADIVARIVMSPAELPIGIITSFIGV
ncbi:MAG: iron ABC transporter permease, partial [Candidatus Jordarchaeaceae archaeon]